MDVVTEATSYHKDFHRSAVADVEVVSVMKTTKLHLLLSVSETGHQLTLHRLPKTHQMTDVRAMMTANK